MPTFLPSVAPQCRSGEYVVIPAHSSGATAGRFTFGDRCSTNRSSTTMDFEYPPYVIFPGRLWSGLLYVNVTSRSQYCSSHRWQLGHFPHEPTMQPTAAKSPALKLETSRPTFVTRPTISCPGTTGNTTPGHSPRAVCRSEWHTPQYWISNCTSCGPGSRRSMDDAARGVVPVWAA